MDKGRRDVNCMTVGSYGSFGCTKNGAVYLDKGKRRRQYTYVFPNSLSSFKNSQQSSFNLPTIPNQEDAQSQFSVQFSSASGEAAKFEEQLMRNLRSSSLHQTALQTFQRPPSQREDKTLIKTQYKWSTIRNDHYVSPYKTIRGYGAEQIDVRLPASDLQTVERKMQYRMKR